MEWGQLADSEKIRLIGFENKAFSKDQLEFIVASALELQDWVEKYRISPESVEIEDAEEREESNPGTIFTLSFAPAHVEGFSLRYGVVPGIDPDEDEYLISEIKFDDFASPYPYTIIDAFCTVCGGPGSDTRECINCVDGELSVDLYWDSDWNVTAEHSDPVTHEN